MNKEIKYPNKWIPRKFREDRFRSDYGKMKTVFKMATNSGFRETENSDFVDGYRLAIKDIKFLNR